MGEPATQLDSNDRYEIACDQAIAMCGGHHRGAIKALIMANEFLEMELAEAQAQLARDVSPGYARRKAT